MKKMLKIRVERSLHWSASPWNQITRVPVGSIVEFVSTRPPCNISNDRCDYHENVESCRHIVIAAFGTEFMTNICMEEARNYFTLVEYKRDI